ncbi:putative lipoprotein YiaD precursor [compost metagenome]
MTLSQKRAEAVMAYATTIGVDPKRMMAQGMGITEPVADNNTTAGRAQNRRVEFFIVANDKLKQEAAKSSGGKK